MSKKIEFDYEKEHYILEYNRNAIKTMEKQGFDAEAFAAKPMVMVELAFEGAFLKNHSKITKAKVDEIYNLFSNKKELIQQLIIMINESYEELLEDNKEESSKNIEWKIG